MQKAAYGDRHVELVRLVGARLTGAVAAAEQDALHQRELEKDSALAELGWLVSTAPTLADVFEEATDKVRVLIPFETLGVASLDTDGRGIGKTYRSADGSLEETDPIATSLLKETLRKAAPTTVQSRAADGSGERSFVAVPLLVSGDVVGTMSIGSPSNVSYGENDLIVAERIAAHLAGAVAHERLKGLREPEARELGALTEMGRLIAACSDVSKVYGDLLLPFDRLEVATVDLEKDAFIRRFSAGTGLDDGGTGVPLPMAGTMVEQTVRSGSAVVVEAATAPDVLLRLPSANAEAEAGLRSFLGVPLVSNSEIVGAYALCALEPGGFADSDLDLAERAGLQLAGALANARLRAAQIADAEEVAGLAEIGRVITSSVDIDEVYDTLCDSIERLVRFDRLAIWTVDLLRQNLVVSYLRGADEPGFERGRSFPLASATGRGLLSSQSGAVVKEDTARAMSQRFPGLVTGAGDRTPEVIIVPLLSGGEQVGMITLKAPADEPYTDRDVAVAERIAAQIAGPVANAQVYLETKQVEAAVKPESTEGGRLVSILKWPEGAPLNLG